MKRFLPIFALFLLFVSCEPKKDATAVTGVKLDRTTLTLTQGSSERLIATVSPSTALNKKVTWSVDDPGVASVNGDGTVTGVGIGVATVKVMTVSGGHEAKCKVTVKKGTSTYISVQSVSVSPATLKLWEGETATLTVKVEPLNATNKTVTWSNSDASVASVDQSGKVTALKEGETTLKAECGTKSGSCKVTVKKRTMVDFAAVDLGLPSGLKWATCNLGADNPEVRGNFYAWGETSAKSTYSLSNYKFWTSGTTESDYKFSKYVTQSKYGNVDNLQVLQRGEKTGETVDDAARVVLGGTWRMPTKEEFEELFNEDNCNLEWTLFNDVRGIKLSGKKAGYTNKWIFLPVTGFQFSSEGLVSEAHGYYWTSTLHYYSNFMAMNLKFYPDLESLELEYVSPSSYESRWYGLVIRPVTN
ncbi:MAG: Ig domain-containing protein [Bacteroidales bacterium]|nr:Ig domain-containing protein [Bacteroidales bacterium]